MKAFKFIVTGIVSILILWTLSACEQDIAVQSVVHEDGSVDRSIIFAKTELAKSTDNLFGLSQQNGWDLAIDSARGLETSEEKDKLDIVFKKHFDSVEEMNEIMNPESDTVFKIESTFEKQFRWFYTYITYTDTYLPINRFRSVDVNDYFTQEDFAFIKRLPAEGEAISAADSVYLMKLNEKIYDHFALRGLFEDQFRALDQTIRASNNARFADTLLQKKELLFGMLVSEKDEAADDFLIDFARKMGIPPSAMDTTAFGRLNKESEKTLDFMSSAAEGKFVHSIQMPWTVIEHNADSIQGKTLTWSPPVVKFMLKPYTMTAVSRQINYWAVILSATVVFLTILAFIRTKRKAVR